MTQQAIYISYYFPPIHSIASVRNAHLVEELRNHFTSIDVITTTNNQLFPKDEYPINGIKIHAVSTYDYRTLFAKNRKNNNTLHHSETKKNNWIVSALIRFNDLLPFSLLLGEGGIIYIYNAYRKVINVINEAQKSSEITVFASYRCTANIVIAYLLKKKFPDLRWVNNFHDAPVNFANRGSVIQWMEICCWRRLLAKSTLNITVSEGVTKTISKLNQRTISIANGITISSSTASSNGKFTLAYTGSLYSDRRDPRPVFKVLVSMIEEGLLTVSNSQLIYAGKDGSSWQKLLENYEPLKKISQHLGNLSRAEVHKIQASAHINLLLTWSSTNEKGILTGKLYEYLGVRNPILALVNGAPDQEINEIFERFSCGQAYYATDDQIQSKLHVFIKNQFNHFTTQSHTLTPIEELKKMSWATQVKKLMNALANDPSS